MINLDEWNPDAKLLIFDDFENWMYTPSPKVYLTHSGEATVTDKYHKKKNINVSMPAIFLTNNMPKDMMGRPICQDPYWITNGSFVYVYEKMYGEELVDTEPPKDPVVVVPSPVPSPVPTSPSINNKRKSSEEEEEEDPALADNRPSKKNRPNLA